MQMKRNFIACVLLSIIIGVYTHYAAWIPRYVGPWVTTMFEQSGACCMHAQRVTCTLISPSIIFHDVQVKPRLHQTWHWKAARYTLGFSWLSLILYGILDLRIVIDDLQAYSTVDAMTPAIAQHITSLTTGQGYTIPSFIASCTLNQAHIKLQDCVQHHVLIGTLDATLQRVDATLQGAVYVRDGMIQYANKPCTTFADGTLHTTIPMHDAHHITSCKIALKPSLSLAGGETVWLHANWQHNQGTIKLSTHSMPIMECSHITRCNDGWHAQITGTVSCADCALLFAGKPYPGTLSFKGNMCTDGTEYTCNDMHLECNGLPLPMVHHILYDGSMRIAGQNISGTGTLSNNDAIAVDTVFEFKGDTQCGSITCSNKQAYAIPYMPTCSLQPHSVHAVLNIDPSRLQGIIDCTIADTRDPHATHQCSGSFMVHDGVFDLTGKHEMGMLEASGTMVPACNITRAVLYDKNHQPLLKACNYPHSYDKLHLNIVPEFLQKMCSALWGYTLQSDGTYTCDLRIGRTIDGRIRMHEGTIRLPGVQNFIRDIDIFGSYDPCTRTGTVTEGVCTLDRGTINIHGARVMLHEDGTLQFCYLPITAHHCMLVLDRGIFALLSADMCITMQEQEPITLSGYMLIDQAHIEGNIFSHLFQQMLATSTRDTFLREYADRCICALTCDSVEPVRIKTAFVETSADISMRITGKASQPSILGKINLNGGSFLFPYRPLYITRGTIYLDEQDPQHSLIELVASNKIRHHDVSMFVSGSLHNHAVTLSASPPLSEEHILSLLLIGSHAESMSMVMPALIMQNLSAFIFDQKQSLGQFRTFFGRLLQPFEHVHFIPVFADQSGRGGLRGTLEVDLSDHLRATIQKNFSLLEDTRVEIEYAVSDDIVVRGMRNERRDVGGEVELKWKF